MPRLSTIGAHLLVAALSSLVLVAAHAQPATMGQPGSSPQASAQPAPHENPMWVAMDVNVRRSTFYRRKDVSGVASLYTPDATYIELMPILQVLKGREQIQGHFEELLTAGAADIVPTVKQASPNADGTILVGGDYIVLSHSLRDDTQPTQISGHFAQILRQQQDGAWRIAMHLFARPDPITDSEFDAGNHD